MPAPKWEKLREAIDLADKHGGIDIVAFLGAMSYDVVVAFEQDTKRKLTDNDRAMLQSETIITGTANLLALQNSHPIVSQLRFAKALQEAQDYARDFRKAEKEHVQATMMEDPDLEGSDIGDMMAKFLKGDGS